MKNSGAEQLTKNIAADYVYRDPIIACAAVRDFLKSKLEGRLIDLPQDLRVTNSMQIHNLIKK